MKVKELSGWQRLWILATVIYFLFLLIISYADFPTVNNSFFEDKDIAKYLSAKTLQILADEGASFDGVTNAKKQITLPTGKEVYISINYTQKDEDYINHDYEKTISKLLNRNRIAFSVAMVALWIIPCLAVYVLGLSFHWVYMGFKKNNE